MLSPLAEAQYVEQIADARELVERQEFDDALGPLREALETGVLDPLSMEEVYRLLAECAAALRRPDEAREAFVNLLAINPDHSVGAAESPLLREPYEEALVYWEENPLPILDYEPPPSLAAGESLVINLSINTEAAPLVYSSLRLNLKQADGSFAPIEAVDLRVDVDPQRFIGAEELLFFLSAHDEHGNTVALVGSESEPLRVELEMSEGVDTSGSSSRRALHRRWWFWTALVGAVGLAVGLSVGLSLGLSGDDDPCEDALGNECEFIIDI